MAIDAINTAYGTYLLNLLSEKSSLDDINKAYVDITKGIKAKLEAEVAAEMAKEYVLQGAKYAAEKKNYEELLKLANDYNKKLQDYNTRAQAGTLKPFELAPELPGQIATFGTAFKAIEQIEPKLENVNALIGANNVAIKNSIDNAATATKSLNALTYSHEKNNETIKKSNRVYETFGKVMSISNSEIPYSDDNIENLKIATIETEKFVEEWQKWFDLAKSGKLANEDLKNSLKWLADGLDNLFSIDTFGFIDSGLVNAFKTAFSEVERLIDDFKGDKFEILQAAVTSLGNVINSIFQAINQNVASTADANLKKIEDNYSKQEESFKTQLDNQIISQEEYDGKIRMLNEQKDAQERRLKHKAFEDERKLALANAAIALAQAELFAYVSGMSTSNPTAPAVAIAYAALATLLGGIQIGIIAARPNPYWMGRVGGPEETATVGEKGFEYISTSTGLFKTPGSTTLTRLPAGASVIPHGLSAQLDRYLGMPSVSKITKVPDAASNSETNQLLREIKNKQTVSMNIDKNGLAVYMHRGSAWSKHINNHIMGYK